VLEVRTRVRDEDGGVEIQRFRVSKGADLPPCTDRDGDGFSDGPHRRRRSR
jgi:hypothetical protein